MLINLRNALMAGKRLPYDAEVEYLESSGTQYIDVDASKVATASRYVCYGQYMVSFNQAMMWSHGYRGIRSYGGRIGFVTGKYATTNTTVTYDTGCIIDFDAVSLKGILTSPSGTELANVTIGSSSASGGLRIFAASKTATGYIASQSRLYFMRVYDAAGNILFDFIPVRKGTVGYLYDRVSGKLFGNAGTGDFVLGQDVVPVEYIESHGTEYIDTATGGCTKIEFRWKTPTPNNDLKVYGNPTNGNKYLSVALLSKVYRGTSIPTSTDWDIVKLDTSIPSMTVERNGVVIGTASSWWTGGSGTTGPNIYPIFGRVLYASGAMDVAGTKFVSYFKAWDANNTFVRDFIPVRVGTDATSWEGAMMDVLTRRIYRNAGTGAFAYGNDLKYPIPAE